MDVFTSTLSERPDIKMKPSGKSDFAYRKNRLYMYGVKSRLLSSSVKNHGSLHLYGKRRIWYVFPYIKLEDAKKSQNTA